MRGLVAQNHVTKWTHMLDPESKFNLGKAQGSCKHCYGTGVVGTLPLLGSARLVCKCVVKKTVEEEEIINRESK